MAQTLILVVDDDAPINELLCELLEDAGYTTQGCLTIAEAFHILESVRPALIITDLWMETREAGWDFMQQLRNTPKLADLPFILCAAGQCTKPRGLIGRAVSARAAARRAKQAETTAPQDREPH